MVSLLVTSLVHLHVEDTSEELLCHLSYAIKYPPRGILRSKAPIVGGFGCDELVLYGIRELAPATLSTNESKASSDLDQ